MRLSTFIVSAALALGATLAAAQEPAQEPARAPNDVRAFLDLSPSWNWTGAKDELYLPPLDPELNYSAKESEAPTPDLSPRLNWTGAERELAWPEVDVKTNLEVTEMR